MYLMARPTRLEQRKTSRFHDAEMECCVLGLRGVAWPGNARDLLPASDAMHAPRVRHTGPFRVHAQSCHIRQATRWTSRGSLPQYFEGYVIKFAPHKAVKLIGRGKLTFDERFVVHRVVCRFRSRVRH